METNRLLYRACWVAVALAALGLWLLGQECRADDGQRLKTESPYFFVSGAAPGVEALPLRRTDVDVRIVGVIADVTVVQHYRNEGDRAIEAKYVFPGSTRAAVYGMNVRLGERVITARIREKERARIEYEEAREQGKTAALLEQHRPNVFQMNVANILPGDDVRVELRYTELLVPQSGEYEFMFPTVVGPRYNSPQAQQASPWVAQPYQHSGEAPLSAMDIRVTVDAPLSIKHLYSSTHRITQQSDENQRVQVALEAGDAATVNNRDFILRYRLAGDRVESGVLLFRGQDENFFLAMVEPPKAVTPAAITPREFIFVLDVSGSMHGFPLDTAKVMMRELLESLHPGDRFNVMLFSGSSQMLAQESIPATHANVQMALRTIGEYQGSGGTELIPALRRVYRQPKSADVARTVVVVTDGYVSVEREAFELVRSNLSQANLFAFGIGSSVNRHLIEGLARAGMGEPFVVTDSGEAADCAQRLRRMIEAPVLTSVKARFEGLDVYDVEPGALPDVLSERPVVVFGKWRAPLDGQVSGRLVLEGHTAQGKYSHTLDVAPRVRSDAVALRYLWARHRIAALSDQENLRYGDGKLEAEITALGLRYGLLTQYTSFVAVDQVVRNKDAENLTSVNQPLPMPQGVSDLAIGASVPGTPEPGVVASGALVISVLYMLRRRQRRARRRPFTT